VYLSGAALHLEDDPIAVSDVLAGAGVTAVAHNHATVYQARDSAAAAQLVDGLADVVMRAGRAAPINGVNFMPASRCIEAQSLDTSMPSEYLCFAAVGAYAIAVHSADTGSAREATAAQYKMLLKY
jgi:hypothetical protein